MISIRSMSGSGVGLSLLVIAASFSLTACEYEWKEEANTVQGNGNAVASVQVAGVEQPQKGKGDAPQPADVKPVLAPGKDVSGQAALPAKARKLDLTALRDDGELAVSANVVTGGLGMVFDEREDTLAKSEGVNPFKVTFEFKSPRTIRAVRVLSSYSDYSWAFQPDQGDRLFVDTIIDGEWSTITWPEGTPVRRVTVEVLRKYRDNFVHLNEIEFYE